MGLKTRCKQSEYFTWWGVPNVNIKHMPLPILYLWRPFIMQRSTACSANSWQWPYSMQCLINSCFTKFFWGEIQCSPVSWCVSYRGLCIVIRIVSWLCWWYTALIYSDIINVTQKTGYRFNSFEILLLNVTLSDMQKKSLLSLALATVYRPPGPCVYWPNKLRTCVYWPNKLFCSQAKRHRAHSSF